MFVLYKYWGLNGIAISKFVSLLLGAITLQLVLYQNNINILKGQLKTISYVLILLCFYPTKDYNLILFVLIFVLVSFLYIFNMKIFEKQNINEWMK